MKRFLMLVLVLLLLLVVIDVGAKFWIESKVESAAEKRLPDGTTVVASVNSFPILARLGFTAKVKNFKLDVFDIQSDPLDVSRLHLEMHDTRFDRSSLWSDPRITGVRFVELRAYISEEEIRQETGLDIRLFNDGATVKIGNNTVTITDEELGESGLQLSFGASFLETIPLPDEDLVPCDLQYSWRNGFLVFSCTTNHVPDIVLDAIASEGLNELLS